RLGRWLSPRTTSLRRALQAWVLVSICWIVRAAALFLLLGALGIGYSFPLALLFLCAGAAAGALPIGPAGAATQVGGAVPRPSSRRASGPPKHSVLRSPSRPSGFSPEQQSFSSPLPTGAGGRSPRLAPPPDGDRSAPLR